MKILKLLLCFCVMSVGSLYAQSSMKFGHVNTQAILAEMPELKTIEAELQTEYSKLEAQLTDMQESLKTIQMDYVNRLQTMPADERAQLETQIQEGNQKVQTFYQTSQQNLQKKEQELKMPIFEKVTTAIEQVGEENGFLYIFEEAGGLAVYKSQKSVDVSDLVKAKLAQ